MEKDIIYWKLHKEVYTEELDKLDKEIINLIHHHPMSREASLHNERINAEVKRRREFLAMFTTDALKQKIKIEK